METYVLHSRFASVRPPSMVAMQAVIGLDDIPSASSFSPQCELWEAWGAVERFKSTSDVQPLKDLKTPIRRCRHKDCIAKRTVSALGVIRKHSKVVQIGNGGRACYVTLGKSRHASAISGSICIVSAFLITCERLVHIL